MRATSERRSYHREIQDRSVIDLVFFCEKLQAIPEREGHTHTSNRKKGNHHMPGHFQVRLDFSNHKIQDEVKKGLNSNLRLVSSNILIEKRIIQMR